MLIANPCSRVMECQFYTHVFQDGNNHLTLILNDYGPWLPVLGCASATGLWTRGYDYRIHTLLHSSEYRWTKKNLVFSSEIPTAPLDPMLNAQTIIWTKSSQCAYNSPYGVLLYWNHRELHGFACLVKCLDCICV